MPLSQATLINSSDPSTTLNHLLDNVNQILKRARGEMFAPLEQTLHQAFAEAELQCMQQLMETFDWDYPTFNSGGELYFQSSRNNKRYMTLAGEVTIERSLYRTKHNGPTFSPLELNTGLIEGFWTPQAAKQAIHLVSQMTPAEAEGIFKEFGLMAPSKSSLDRLPKKLNPF